MLTSSWLLGAILLSLLMRLEPIQLGRGLRHYLPMAMLALCVFGFRMVFMPNAMMNIILPPVLLFFLVWQLLVCLRVGPQLEQSDRIVGWFSLIVIIVTLVISLMGYIFLSLLVLLFWFFQLACIETLVAIFTQMTYYRDNQMAARVEEYRKLSIT